MNASDEIDKIIDLHGGWKAETLKALRSIILAADPEIVEEVKWKMPTRPEGLPVWSRDGIVCFAEIWKDNVKLIFNKGAQLSDPDGLFNARLNSSVVRAIELHDGEAVDKSKLAKLVQQAAEANAKK